MKKHDDLVAHNKYLEQKIERLKQEKAEEINVLQQEKLELFQVYEGRFELINRQLHDMRKATLWRIRKPVKDVVKSIRQIPQKLQSKNEAKTGETIAKADEGTITTVNEIPNEAGLHLITKAKSINRDSARPRIAVQVHLYWVDLIDELLFYLGNIPFEFDCFISTDTCAKAEIISDRFKSGCKANKISVDVFENRGRDVAPFLSQMSKYIESYDYICHIHTKKTDTGEHGGIWREYLYAQLLGSPASIESIIAEFEEKQSLGIAFPETFPTLLPYIDWSMSKDLCENLLSRVSTKYDIPSLPEKPIFSAGNMFWARADAVKPLFLCGLRSDDFPEEGGQIRESMAHAVERIWVYLARAQGYDHTVFLNMLPKALLDALPTTSNGMKASASTEGTTPMGANSKKRIALYAHSSPDGSETDSVITDADLHLLKSVQAISDFVVFITSVNLSKECRQSLGSVVNKIIVRKNSSTDYGLWKDGILEIGFDEIGKYDQLILLNNSIVGSIYSLGNIFERMDGKNIDFWGITIFPACTDSLYIARNSLDIIRIPEYIESYFQVFEKSVISSKIFRDIWESMLYYDNCVEDRKNAELKMTGILASHGFEYDVYVRVSRYLSDYYDTFDMPDARPYPLVVAGSPFVKRELSIYTPQEEKDKVNYILKSTMRE